MITDNKMNTFISDINIIEKDMGAKKYEAISRMIDGIDWPPEGAVVVEIDQKNVYGMEGDINTLCVFLEKVPEDQIVSVDFDAEKFPGETVDAVKKDYAIKKGYKIARLMSHRMVGDIDKIITNYNNFEAAVRGVIAKLHKYVEESDTIKFVTKLRAIVKIEAFSAEITFYVNTLESMRG